MVVAAQSGELNLQLPAGQLQGTQAWQLPTGQDTHARQLQKTAIPGLSQWTWQTWCRVVERRQPAICACRGVRRAANESCDMAARC